MTQTQQTPLVRNSEGVAVAAEPVALVFSDGSIAGPGNGAPVIPIDAGGRAQALYHAPDGRGVPVVSNMGILFSDGFGGTSLDPTRWDVLPGGLGANPTLDGETLTQAAIGTGQCAAMTYAVSNSQLVVNMQTTLNDELWFLSKQTFAGTEDLTALLSVSPATQTQNSIFVGFVEIDAATGVPLLNPNLPAYFTNMGGVDFGQTGASTYVTVQAVEDASPVLASVTGGCAAVGKPVLQEYTVEFHAEDIICSCSIVDAVSGKQPTAVRLSSQAPNDAKVYKLLLRFRNITAAPASNCVVTLDRILVVGSQEMRVEIASGRGDQNAQKAIAVNPIGAAVLRAGGTNRSLTVTTTAQTAMASNAGRTGWKIKNDTTTDVWISFSGTAAATPGSGNMKVAAGGYLASEPGFVSTAAMSIVCASGTAAVTILEF